MPILLALSCASKRSGNGSTSKSCETVGSWTRAADHHEDFGRDIGAWGETVTWTGSELLVFGGSNFGTCAADPCRNQASYDPVLDEWKRITWVGAPLTREFHTAVWSGQELIVWGGWGCYPPDYDHMCEDGGAYNPAEDSWRPISSARAPDGSNHATAVWAGETMIVLWGEIPGVGMKRGGAMYDPDTDSWETLGQEALMPARSGATVLWLDDRLFVWGGRPADEKLQDGGLYDPVTKEWTPITRDGAPSARVAAASVWTGSEVIIWGGYALGGSSVNTYANGYVYDPQSDTWEPIQSECAPSARGGARAVWTGREMLVYGGSSDDCESDCAPGFDCERLCADGGLYNPSTDSWRRITTTGAPAVRDDPRVAWTGDSMLVYGGTQFLFPAGHVEPIGMDDLWRYVPTAESNADADSGP